MSLRKLEIHVPDEYREDVLEALTTGGGGIGMATHVGENIIVNVCENCTEISVTCTASRAGELIHVLTTSLGVGINYGTVTSLTAASLRPNPNQLVSEFAAIKRSLEQEEKRREAAEAKANPFKAIKLTHMNRKTLEKRKFQYVRTATAKSVEELFNEIIDLSDDSWNFYLSVVCASVISGMGLLTNSSVVVLSAMLISPLMGPILSAAFGLAVRDWLLFRESVLAECRAACVTILCGLLMGFAFANYSIELGDVAIPTNEMASRGRWETLIAGAIIAAASGVVVGTSITSDGVNSLVGVAISASLLPPLVNSGLLVAFVVPGVADDCGAVGNDACTLTQSQFLEMAGVSALLYVMNVIIIMIVASIIFSMQRIGSLKGFQDASNKRLLNFTQRQVRDKLKIAVGMDLWSVETEEAIDKVRRERLANDTLARRAEELQNVENAKHAAGLSNKVDQSKLRPRSFFGDASDDDDDDDENNAKRNNTGDDEDGDDFSDAKADETDLDSPPMRKRPYNPNYSVLRPFPEPAGVERPAFLETTVAHNVGHAFSAARNTIVGWLNI